MFPLGVGSKLPVNTVWNKAQAGYWGVVALHVHTSDPCCMYMLSKKGFGLANIRASQQRWMGMIPIGSPIIRRKGVH